MQRDRERHSLEDERAGQHEEGGRRRRVLGRSPQLVDPEGAPQGENIAETTNAQK
jgi:hypothetical protein